MDSTESSITGMRDDRGKTVERKREGKNGRVRNHGWKVAPTVGDSGGARAKESDNEVVMCGPKLSFMMRAFGSNAVFEIFTLLKDGAKSS